MEDTSGSTSDCDNAHPELRELLSDLQEIHTAVAHFGPTLPPLPILDSSVDKQRACDNKEAVPGLRTLREAVKRDLDVLEKFLADPKSAYLPPLSTNAPYLISVWHEVLLARQPIITIWRTFQEIGQIAPVRQRGSQKPAGVKVDVVADDGRHWIRVNTIKNSRLLAEFREMDSYMTDSEDESEDENGRPSLAAMDFDNSLLRMGRQLLAAAKQNQSAGTDEIPSITLRLTRLDPAPADPKEHDPRILRTIEGLRAMGIAVQLGERDRSLLPSVSLSPRPAPRYEPTLRINLDLSMLIALVSDITHAPLPPTADDAHTRFVPPAAYREWKRKRLEAQRADTVDAAEVDEGSGKHARALASQALQEMRRGLLDEIRDRLAALVPSHHSFPQVEFWTTPDARARCLKIVLSKIGGPNEQRRARALFPDATQPLVDPQEAVDAYWETSRYPRQFVPLLPIRIFPGTMPDDIAPDMAETGSVFFGQLARMCRVILAQETVPAGSSAASSQSSLGEPGEKDKAEEAESDDDLKPAAVTRANPRLTAHTVQSLLWGAAQGWTTLTANKTSVKAILREIKAARLHGYQWEQGSIEAPGADAAGEDEPAEKAALWIVDPRSLAEGMRSDYGPS